MLENNSKITEKERQSNLRRLEASYVMYEKSKNDTLKKYDIKNEKTGKPMYPKGSLDETVTLMINMQNEIKDEYRIYGGDIDYLVAMKYDENNENYTDKDTDDGYYDEDEEYDDTEVKNVVLENKTTKKNIDSYLNSIEKIETTNNNTPTKKQPYEFDTTRIKEAFDVIPLPSGGECYANKMGKIPVAYLTAYDENIIVSPNLYRDGTFLDYLLKAKILDPVINPDDLLPGDRDAIILWLRATGYGNEFPVNVTDNETGREFNSVVDLSKIGYKEFTLKGDENGWFKFILPVSKDEIKFTFLTHGELQKLNEMEEKENLSIRQKELKTISNKLMQFKKNDLSKVVTKQFSKRIDEAVKVVDEWYDMIDPDVDTQITHTMTNKMMKSIKSINGITDPKYIREYIVKMNIRDSAALRKYMLENEPGVDFTIEVERPKSLGGGSMTTFLTFDQFVFLNYA